VRRVLVLVAVALWGGCSSPTPPSCVYSVSRTSVSLPPGGGSATVSVTAGSTCTWTAVSSAGWLAVTSGSSGTGDGIVTFAAGANGASARSATLTVASRTVAVSQDGVHIPTFVLSGRVTDAFVGPAIGLAGVSVTVVGGPSQGSDVTDAAGDYDIGGLVAGVYEVAFSRTGYAATTVGAAVSGPTSLPMALSLDVPAAPSSSNLTGYWSGTGDYPNAPFRLALVQDGSVLRGIYVDQHDVSLSVSGASGSAAFVLRVDFGDAVLFLECEIEDPREVNGVQRTSALGNRPYPFTMKR